MLQALIQSFSRHATEFGFFLHVPRFLQQISSFPATGHAKQTSALLNTIYLLGAYFSSDSQLRVLQADFRSRALAHFAAALTDAPSAGVIHMLQAEVLLAYYFFSENRILEAVYHSNAASAIALACKLHLIRSPRGQSPPGSLAGGVQFRLDPPMDSIDEGERINGFWCAYVLDKCLAFASGIQSAFTDDESKGTQIDAPWPLDIKLYESSPIPAGFRSSRTVWTFLRELTFQDADQSALALHAKAATLLEYATKVAARVEASGATSSTEFTQLDSRIERFKQSLPSIESVAGRADLMRKLMAIHVLGHCATIELHKNSDVRGVVIALYARSLNAAHATVDLLNKIDLDTVALIDPFIGILMTRIADALIRGVKFARRANSSQVRASLADEEATLLQSVRRILSALEKWGRTSPSIHHQHEIVLAMLA